MALFLQDVRYALRLLGRQPGFTLVAVLTLALGIGANTAIFSIVNAVVLEPLPYEQPEQLVVLWSNPDGRSRSGAASVDDFLDWRAQQRSFEGLSALAGDEATLTAAGSEPERVRGVNVSANFFGLLRVKPAFGRPFIAEEEQFGGPAVIMLSHGLWQRRFASDPTLVGRTVQLDSEAHTVVGVMPPGFDFPAGFAGREPDYWTPARFDTSEPNRGAHFLRVFGRLRPGIGIDAAQSEMTALARRLEEQFPLTNTNWGLWLFPLHEEFAGDVRTPLLVLFGAVVCVLLIACANVANLLLARATVRSKELAVRVALGAGRVRLLRQLLTETLVLATCGALLGLALAAWSLELVPVLAADSLPRATTIDIDLRVLLFTMGAALFTGVVFGLAPALHVARAAVADALRAAGRSAGASPGTHRVRTALIVSEVALAFVLLIGAGLMIRSFHQLEGISPGFLPGRILTAQLSLPSARYGEGAQQAAFTARLLERARHLPGVEEAAATTLLPLGRQDTILVFSIEGRPDEGPGKWPIARYSAASDGYFQTMGQSLVRGRLFTPRDTGDQGVAIVSSSLVRKYFPDEDPLGRRVKMDSPDADSPWVTIVGVVDDIRHRSLGRAVEPMIYEPLSQTPRPYFSLVVRSPRAPGDVATDLRGLLASMDRGLALDLVRPMSEVIDASLASERFRTRLLGVFAAVALLLAAIGLYGVMAYSVEQRSQEMGLRMALGAEPRHLLKLITGQGMRMALAGIAVGLAAALGLTRVVESLLYGVSPTDPWTFAAIAALLLAVSGLATYLPARRATTADPMVVLRTE